MKLNMKDCQPLTLKLLKLLIPNLTEYYQNWDDINIALKMICLLYKYT